MKKSVKSFGFIAILAVIGFLAACDNGGNTGGNNGLKTLSGDIWINPSEDVTTGTELSAAYSGYEEVTYLWKKGEAIVGTNSNRYTPGEAGTYTVTVMAANYNSKTSAAVTVTGASLPALTGTVSIIGIAEIGQILRADTGSLGGSGEISYQWKRSNGTNIGTNSVSYTVQSADIGTTITVTVIRAGFSGSITSAPTAVVVSEAPPTPGLAYAKINGDTAWSVSRGTATAAEVVIPALHEGLPVNAIAANGFSSYTNMTSVRIPDRVTTIGSYAFSNCTALTTVTIPNNVTSISSSVFTGCTGLMAITIPFFGSGPNGTSPIGYLFGASSATGQNAFIPTSLKTVIITGGNSVPAYTFSGCTNLTSVSIPNTVLSIGQNAFSDCTSLPSITIPDTVTSIGASAFSGCTSLPNITIPNSVTSIGASVFSGCTSLPNITIPNSVTSIGQSAFSGCSSLTSITIPFVGAALDGTSNTHFGYIFGSSNSSIPVSLKTVIITGGKGISQVAFAGCSGLTSVTIPDSVTSIGGGAFYDCSGLTSVTIGNSVTSIGGGAFQDCSGLTSINFNATALADLTSSTVFQNAGQNAAGITVIIGANVTKIPAFLFSGDYRGSKITAVSFVEGSVCQSIGGGAFQDCSGLTSVTIPNSVTSIGERAFSGCSGLIGSLTIPDSVTSIGGSAFRGCLGLTSVTIGNSVTSIGGGAFQNCSGLTSVTIPNCVTSIGGYAFYDCGGLTSVTFQGTIPSGSFVDYAFGDANNSGYLGDLRSKFYATNSSYGTPGTYTRPDTSSKVWTKQ